MNKNNQNKRTYKKGGDKQHPETPPDANERARKDQEKDKNKTVDEDPGSQISS